MGQLKMVLSQDFAIESYISFKEVECHCTEIMYIHHKKRLCQIIYLLFIFIKMSVCLFVFLYVCIWGAHS